MLFDIRIKSILVNSNPILSLCSEDIVAHEVLSSLVLYLKHYQILSVDFRIYILAPTVGKIDKKHPYLEPNPKLRRHENGSDLCCHQHQTMIR